MKLTSPSFINKSFISDLQSVHLLEYFLISAVSSLLVLRGFLNLTGFPQLAKGDFHIAHMLWGGLFMMISIVLFISFMNAKNKIYAAVMGGIGFGMFIDELGKFITADNDYFFQPTIAIIYVIFVFLFFLIKFLSTIISHNEKTYAVNAIDALKEFVIADLDEFERANALKYLSYCDKKDPLIQMIYSFIKDAKPINKKQSVIRKISVMFYSWYKNVLHVKIISKGLITFFVIVSTINMLVSLHVLLSGTTITFAQAGSIISSCIIGVFVILGLLSFIQKRVLETYKYLQYATLVAIFLYQFFLFLQDELSAVVYLGIFVSLYLILDIAIEAESASHKE